MGRGEELKRLGWGRKEANRAHIGRVFWSSLILRRAIFREGQLSRKTGGEVELLGKGNHPSKGKQGDVSVQ